MSLHPLDEPKTLEEALERIQELEVELEARQDEIDDHTAADHCTSDLILALKWRDLTDSEEAELRGVLDGDTPLDHLDALPPAKLAQVIEALLTEPRFDMARRIMERNGRLSA